MTVEDIQRETDTKKAESSLTHEALRGQINELNEAIREFITVTKKEFIDDLSRIKSQIL